jgi:hypothetical protein
MHLGVDGGPNRDAFDITSISPFGHIHMLSGVFHDPVHGQSGVIRFNRQIAAFEQSVDGGNTFEAIQAGAAGGVTAIGVIGGAELTGSVDLGPTASGFIVIEDTAGASPVTFSVDTAALSGLWSFPTNGFGSIPTCYNESFTSASIWSATHNLNTLNVLVMAYDNNDFTIIPDRIATTDANTVAVQFNVAQVGRLVIMACENS